MFQIDDKRSFQELSWQCQDQNDAKKRAYEEGVGGVECAWLGVTVGLGTGCDWWDVGAKELYTILISCTSTMEEQLH
jgi:hypothetical protein